MYNDNPILAPTTISFDTHLVQRCGITLPTIPRHESLFMSGRTHSLQSDSHSITTNALFGARSLRHHRSLLHTKVRSASINSFKSRKGVARSTPQSPSPSPRHTRVLGKSGITALIGPLKSLNFKKLGLNRGGGKHQAKQKAVVGVQCYDSDFDSGKGLLERLITGDIDVDMDSRPLSARSFTGDMETDIDQEAMIIDSPTIQFAVYAPCPDDSDDPFATPQASATMSVDSSPLSSITNSSILDSRKKRLSLSQEAALRSQLKTLQLLGPEASAAIALKYESLVS
ncbi:hypothetical protein BYT27DRAFT_7195931 [Phlegmacium glaucopus]|nr:hypothetical protein BYT27DRAFT_7195931 [Phlegmacium glaucopus]